MSRPVGVKETKPRAEGGGRKPSEYTQLKRRLQAEKVEDAEYAFSLYSQVMRDEEMPLTIRMTAATWIAERVLGKPAQLQPTDSKDELYQKHFERLRKVMFEDESKSP